MRSLIPKIENFSLDMKEREVDIAFLTEVWEKLENKKHQSKLVEMLEMEGVQYISTPRPGAKRGGGAAIAVRLDRFTINKLNISIPKGLEVVWGLMKPKVISGKISKIISCCFYSPPRSKKRSALVDHISLTLQHLLSTHPNAGIVISGDRNSLDVPTLLNIDPSLRQLVKMPTRGLKILDIILSNLERFYDEPIIVPPILPDKPNKGVPSDHSGVIATPHTDPSQPQLRTKVVKTIRPLPESLISVFGQKLEAEDWTSLDPSLNSTEMVNIFQNLTEELVLKTFPSKKIQIYPDDKPWFNEKLRNLRRQRQRIYRKEGKNEKYLQCAKKFEDMREVEILKYKEKIENEVREGKRGSCYAGLRKLGSQPGESSQTGFQLPNHAEQNLSNTDCAEKIATYFSKVSQEYPPVIVANLPPNIRAHLGNPEQNVAPELSYYDVFNKLVKAKKPNSMVPGDLPRKLIQRFPYELTLPISIIFNKISQSKDYPEQWKVERQIPIPKVHPPMSEDDLRNIAKTQFLSKVYEACVADWLLPIIQPYLDPGQCGLKGMSITHYLIKLLHFTHSILDLKKPYAVLAACIDLAKAFNRVSHDLLVQDLYDMHTPAWLLNILISYLSKRTMVMTYKGETSTSKDLPGGGPQGAYLGGLIFIIKYNGALMRPPIPPLMTGPIWESKAEKVKFVDDGTVAVSINLKKCLIKDPNSRPRPLNFRERTETILPAQNNLLQSYMDDTESFTEENLMKINSKKSKVLLFNKSRKWDFPPEVSFSDDQNLEVLSDIRLLGVVVSDDLRWEKNTQYICKKAMQRMWTIKRMKHFKLGTDTLLDTYTKEIRSLLELAVPVWHSGLTAKQVRDIERVQKTALYIILGDAYTNYEVACTLLEIEPLEMRREQLCLKFAKKDFKKEKSLLNRVEKTVKTRSNNLVIEPKCNTKRFQKSSIPYLSKLLNKNA